MTTKPELSLVPAKPDPERIRILARADLQRTDWKLMRAMERHFAGTEWCDWRDVMRDIASKPEGHGEPLPPEPPFGQIARSEPTPDLSTALSEANAALEEARKRIEELEKERAAVPVHDPVRFVRDEDLLADYGAVGGEPPVPLSALEADAEATRILSNMADGFDVGDEISGLSSVRRQELTQALHRKKGAMRRARMTGSAPEEAEGAIDQLVDLLARRGV